MPRWPSSWVRLLWPSRARTILIGKDTRLSGDMLESAVAAGIMSMGGTALLAGIIPTPAIALLTRELHCDGGIVISASHNPPEYNGIKIFDGQGFKLPDCRRGRDRGLHGARRRCSRRAARWRRGGRGGARRGRLRAVHRSTRCRAWQKQGIDFKGLKVALDTGHGASCMTSAEALRRLGADVTVINDDYCGTDINVQCGSTHLEPRARPGGRDAVRTWASRTTATPTASCWWTPSGNEIDGDVVEAVCAIDLEAARPAGRRHRRVHRHVRTWASTHALRDAGIDLVQTKVGDRYVLEAMREGGFVVGGEQSGHMIFLEHNSTGDGLVTALQFLAACKRAGKSVGEAALVMTRFPQTLVNVQRERQARRLMATRPPCRRRGRRRGGARRGRPRACCARAAPSRSCA